MKHALVLAAALCLTVSPLSAHAAEEAASTSTSSNKSVEFSGLIMPVSHDGKLINYLFVTAQIEIADGYDQWEFREHAHVYRDLVLREAHKVSVAKPKSPMELDLVLFEQVVKSAFARADMGDAVSGISIVTANSQKVFVKSATN